MSETATPEAQPGKPEPAAATTAGGMLREARESMHVDIAVLAAMLKVPEHKLLALEADRFEALPDLTFARALAASVCRTLKIEPAPGRMQARIVETRWPKCTRSPVTRAA